MLSPVPHVRHVAGADQRLLVGRRHGTSEAGVIVAGGVHGFG
jgi:hypothetical protein